VTEEKVVAAIQALANGRSVIHPQIVDGMIAQLSPTLTSPVSELTARQREALANLPTGKSNAAIATALYQNTTSRSARAGSEDRAGRVLLLRRHGRRL
jgi:DNA-binding NarL/FixJ family response regulator